METSRANQQVGFDNPTHVSAREKSNEKYASHPTEKLARTLQPRHHGRNLGKLVVLFINRKEDNNTRVEKKRGDLMSEIMARNPKGAGTSRDELSVNTGHAGLLATSCGTNSVRRDLMRGR